MYRPHLADGPARWMLGMDQVKDVCRSLDALRMCRRAQRKDCAVWSSEGLVGTKGRVWSRSAVSGVNTSPPRVFCVCHCLQRSGTW